MQVIKITFLLSILLIASCSTTNNKDNVLVEYSSNDWLKEKFKKRVSNPLNINIKVKKINHKTLKLNFQFTGLPLSPVFGLDPSSFHYFLFCLNSHLASKEGYKFWRIGSLEDTKYNKTKELELYISFVDDKNSLKSIQEKPLNWQKIQESIKFKSMCTGFLKEKYINW